MSRMSPRHFTAALALSAVCMPLSTSAQPSVYVQIAPPAPRYEAAPVIRHGHVWVPGHWQWNGRAYMWINGHYVRERAGYHYTPGHWQQSRHGWVYVQESWSRGHRDHGPRGHAYGRRDSDRDGVPDRHDRDRDGDGVPNRYDRRPDNPNRR